MIVKLRAAKVIVVMMLSLEMSRKTCIAGAASVQNAPLVTDGTESASVKGVESKTSYK